MANNTKPTAFVFLCGGAAEGAHCAVRALGEEGVPVTLVSEQPDPPSRWSRYVTRFIHLENFSRDSIAVSRLLEEALPVDGSPVVALPTADPDLKLLSDLLGSMDERVRIIAPEPAMLADLSDKGRFSAVAEQVGIRVPRTRFPSCLAEVSAAAAELVFPLVVKPADPMKPVPVVLAGKKAIRVEESADLFRIAGILLQADCPFVVQEFVPGPDEAHIDLHAFVVPGRPSVCFTGRKLRIFPVHAGSGCYVVSEVVEDARNSGLDALSRLGYSGLANINFKRHERTGELWMLEINPRLSQWNILPTRCGVNFPYIAYAAAIGIPQPLPARQQTGLRYLNFSNDLRAACAYRAEGSMAWSEYLSSVLNPGGTVYQTLDMNDPAPWFASIRSEFRQRLATWRRRDGG